MYVLASKAPACKLFLYIVYKFSFLCSLILLWAGTHFSCVESMWLSVSSKKRVLSHSLTICFLTKRSSLSLGSRASSVAVGVQQFLLSMFLGRK